MKQVMKCGDCGAVLEPRLRDSTLFIDHRCKEKDERESGFNACCFKSLCLENARELAQTILERDSARNVLARAIERERLANMRADQAEEAREAAQSAIENSDTAKDAARYRWLRSASVFDGTLKVDDGPDWWGDLGDVLADKFDEMVDAAMAAADNRSADKGQG